MAAETHTEPFVHLAELTHESAVVASASTDEHAWVQVDGLQPDTSYRYRIVVDGEEWAAGERPSCRSTGTTACGAQTPDGEVVAPLGVVRQHAEARQG